MGVNERFKKWKEENRYTSTEIASWLGVSKSAVSQVMAGKSRLSITTMQKLLVADPELNARWLLTGEGTMLNAGAAVMKAEYYELMVAELERIIEAKSVIIKLLREAKA